MSKRTERRAAERANRHLPQPAPQVSAAQLAANRANAQHSTGPATTAGKQTSSLNALKHGLTSRTVVLDGEDVAAYKLRLDSYLETYNPQTYEEQRLVQSLVDSVWRIERVQQIESAIFLKGKLEFAHQFADQPACQRDVLTLLETELKYQKTLRNLQIQEARLRRYFEKDRAQLLELQETRSEQEELAASEEAGQPATASPNNAQSNAGETTAAESSPENGFVFSSMESSAQAAQVNVV